MLINHMIADIFMQQHRKGKVKKMDMKHSRKSGLTGRQKKQIRLVLLLLPFMIMIGIFSYAPLFGWSYAFVEFTPGVSIFKSQFVGLKYFKKIFENSKDFVTVMRNTLSISFLNICCSVLPAIFAIAISQLKNKRYAKLVQTGTSIPNFISWVLVYSIVFMLLSSEDSALNIILMGLGIIKKPLNVLTNENMHGQHRLLSVYGNHWVTMQLFICLRLHQLIRSYTKQQRWMVLIHGKKLFM